MFIIQFISPRTQIKPAPLVWSFYSSFVRIIYLVVEPLALFSLFGGSSSLFYQTPLINQLSHPANSNSSAPIGSSGSLHHSIYGKDHFNAKRHGGYCNYSDYKSNVCSQLCDYRVLYKENRHGKWRQVRPANIISYNYLIILFITGLAQNCYLYLLVSSAIIS